jgi:hypothetical protein
MIWIRGNWLGLGMFVASGIIALIGGFFLKLSDVITMISVGIFLTVLDLAFRLIINKQENKLFGKETGGFFFFVPVWILGIIVVIINIVNASGVMK